MKDDIQLTYEKFKEMLEKWDKHFFITEEHLSGGCYSISISYFAKELWETLATESGDVQKLCEQTLARNKAEQFKELYSDSEEIASRGINPCYPPIIPFNSLDKSTQQIIMEEHLLDNAIKNYTKAGKIVEKEENKQKQQRKEKRQKDVGVIYIIKSEYGFKIGKTKNLKNRIALFSVKLPFTFEIIHSAQYEGYHLIEEELHSIFEHKHINGEWFNLNDVDIDYIKMYKIEENHHVTQKNNLSS